jgi:hypothetical protein
MHQQRVDARAEYLQEEKERIKGSASLAERFKDLKSLSVLLTFFSSGSTTRHTEIKYTVNLAFAKSLFRFTCPNNECVGGNFDLSTDLARAVGEHRKVASGELRCPGWQSKTTIDAVHCGQVLRYNLSLGY